MLRVPVWGQTDRLAPDPGLLQRCLHGSQHNSLACARSALHRQRSPREDMRHKLLHKGVRPVKGLTSHVPGGCGQHGGLGVFELKFSGRWLWICNKSCFE